MGNLRSDHAYALLCPDDGPLQSVAEHQPVDRVGQPFGHGVAGRAGAYFGSIEKTFFHVLWADRVWMSRFSSLPSPGGGLQDSIAFPKGWAAFREQRTALDHEILLWASQLDEGWFWDDMPDRRTGAIRGRSELVIQMFIHQTHHRGQIHAMLTSAGACPDDTDIFHTPQEYRALPH